MDSGICFLFMGIIILATLIFALISANSRKTKKHLNIEYFRLKYLEAENKLKANEPTTYQIAILEADKLVDQALRERGFNGETMGERLKNATNSKVFSDRNCIWLAHKLRNQIAHEPDVKVSYKQARGALVCFKKALKDLGAI